VIELKIFCNVLFENCRIKILFIDFVNLLIKKNYFLIRYIQMQS